MKLGIVRRLRKFLGQESASSGPIAAPGCQGELRCEYILVRRSEWQALQRENRELRGQLAAALLAMGELKAGNALLRGRVVVPDDATPERKQVLDIPKVKPVATDYLVYSGVCERCGKRHQGQLPEGVPDGMVGQRATALVAVLSGKYHLSTRSIMEMLRGKMRCIGTGVKCGRAGRSGA